MMDRHRRPRSAAPRRRKKLMYSPQGAGLGSLPNSQPVNEGKSPHPLSRVMSSAQLSPSLSLSASSSDMFSPPSHLQAISPGSVSMTSAGCISVRGYEDSESSTSRYRDHGSRRDRDRGRGRESHAERRQRRQREREEEKERLHMQEILDWRPVNHSLPLSDTRTFWDRVKGHPPAGSGIGQLSSAYHMEEEGVPLTRRKRRLFCAALSVSLAVPMVCGSVVLLLFERLGVSQFVADTTSSLIASVFLPLTLYAALFFTRAMHSLITVPLYTLATLSLAIALSVIVAATNTWGPGIAFLAASGGAAGAVLASLPLSIALWLRAPRRLHRTRRIETLLYWGIVAFASFLCSTLTMLACMIMLPSTVLSLVLGGLAGILWSVYLGYELYLINNRARTNSRVGLAIVAVLCDPVCLCFPKTKVGIM
ncbi:hypothetical protein KIPB_004525 [Kipferlia bialata]|uniref:Transmembrane protein n=1 Tax=Kipferlia bialata TaxID=797122 RepID=A0A9K3GGM7_9EUKA|nr:hypothetical protein KIPB_004525 [Kipferlia bialata]|eukprot:g4525.t1